MAVAVCETVSRSVEVNLEKWYEVAIRAFEVQSFELQNSPLNFFLWVRCVAAASSRQAAAVAQPHGKKPHSNFSLARHR